MTAITELSRSLKGSRVLITGAASGMGRATAAVFASEGARVAVTDFDADGARSVAEQLTRAGYQAEAWHLDVSDPEAIRSVIDSVVVAFGGLDVLINNAGISGFSAID